MADVSSVARSLSDRLIKRLTTVELHDALSDVADQITRDAQRRAPIRKIFKRGRSGPRSYHIASPRERRAMLAAAKQVGIKKVGRSYPISRKIRENRPSAGGRAGKSAPLPALGHVVDRQRFSKKQGTYYTKNLRRVDSLRRFKKINGIEQELLNPIRESGYEFRDEELQGGLTSRARYDLAHGRGVEKMPGGNIVLGGGLRRSIGAEAVRIEGNRVSVSIVAEAPYAKYVEFGTYKDPAQPFLYPALKASKRLLHAELRRRLKVRGG